MGRHRDNERTSEHFTQAIRNTMESEAFRSLSTCAQSLYWWVRLEWKGTKANNNGQIRLSVRQAAQRLGVGSDTAARAFHDLQRKGFLVVTEPARLGLGGAAKSPAYEITEIALPQSKGNPRKLFKDWRKGADFAVQKVMANNPKGTNGKKKTCHQNQDSTVINIGTARRVTS